MNNRELLQAMNTLVEAVDKVNHLWKVASDDVAHNLHQTYRLSDDLSTVGDQCELWLKDMKERYDPLHAEINGLLKYIEMHVRQCPLGGYTNPEDTVVKITVGKKTAVFYDHAALLGGLMEALKLFKAEL